MVVAIGRGRVALNTGTGNQALTATMAGVTPKLALFRLTRATAVDSLISDSYYMRAGTDGVTSFVFDFAEEDGVNPTVGRMGTLAGAAGSTNCGRLRRIDNTGDTTNQDFAFDFVSFTAETVTINITNAPAGAFLLEYVLIGGDDFTVLVDTFTTTINVGTPLDRTGLGVPCEAALLFNTRTATGIIATAAAFTEGYWASSSHSSRGVLSSDFGAADNPATSEMTIRDDCNVCGLVGSGLARGIMSQLSTGYRITATETIQNRTVVVAMAFNKKRVAWAGLMQTGTTLTTETWKDAHIRPDLVLASFSRMPTKNVELVDDADASVMGGASWTPSGNSAIGLSSQNDGNPSVAKSHAADRFLSIPQNDGTLTGSPTTPAAGDAILATAAEHAEGLDLTYTRTSSIARQVAVLLIGDEQTLVPSSLTVPLVLPAPTLKTARTPAPLTVPLVLPAPRLALIRPTPLTVALVLPAPILFSPQPVPMLELPPDLGPLYHASMLDLLPRGLCWAKSPGAS